MKHPLWIERHASNSFIPCAQQKHLARSTFAFRLCSLRRATDYSGNYACILATSLLGTVCFTTSSVSISSIPTLSIPTLVNIDKMGIDKVRIDKLGIDKVRRYYLAQCVLEISYFCATKKKMLRCVGGGCHLPNDSTWQLLCLAVERPWCGTRWATSLSLSTNVCRLKCSILSSCRNSISGTVGSF